jgi:hypothetical protein
MYRAINQLDPGGSFWHNRHYCQGIDDRNVLLDHRDVLDLLMMCGALVYRRENPVVLGDKRCFADREHAKDVGEYDIGQRSIGKRFGVSPIPGAIFTSQKRGISACVSTLTAGFSAMAGSLNHDPHEEDRKLSQRDRIALLSARLVRKNYPIP